MSAAPDIDANRVAAAKKRERTTMSFTGDEIIRALQPLISERLKGMLPNRSNVIDIVATRWMSRPVEYTSSEPIPPGYSPMTTDVVFTLEWDAIEAEAAK